MPTLAEQLLTVRAELETLDTEKAVLDRRINELYDQRLVIKAKEEDLEREVLGALREGLGKGQTFAVVGAELDARVKEAVAEEAGGVVAARVDDPRL